jgi:Ca-activated chloride channel homolog
VSFAWPLALVGLLLVPAAVLGYLFAERRRARAAGRFARAELLPNVLPARPGRKRHVPVAVALVAFALVVVGVARPHVDRTKQRDEATVVLAIDTSRSMAATDLEPNRLDAARTAASAFLERVPESYAVGIVAFANSADVVLPPTRDREAATQALAELRLGAGTAIGAAITRSVDMIKQRQEADYGVSDAGVSPGSVLLLSDGAQTGEGVTPQEAAATARDARVPVYTVAVGTGDAVVEVPLPGGLTERVVVSPDPETLQAVAEQTGGRAFSALDADELTTVYRDLGTRLVRERQETEVTSLFALGGAGALLVASALSAIWFRRPL